MTTKRSTKAAVAAIGAVALSATIVPQRASATVPVIDGAAIASIVETTTVVAQQIEQIRRAIGAVQRLQSAIGIEVIDLGPVNNMLEASDQWLGETESQVGEATEYIDRWNEWANEQNEKEENAEQGASLDRNWWDGLLIRSAHAEETDPTPLPPDNGPPPIADALKRGGSVNGWADRKELDRPRLKTYGEARKFAAETLFAALEEGGDPNSADSSEREAIADRYRLRIAMATAVHAWSIGTASASSWPKRQAERAQLAKMLRGANTLREDIQTLTAATIVGATARADAAMLAATELELRAIHSLNLQPTLIGPDDATLLDM